MRKLFSAPYNQNLVRLQPHLLTTGEGWNEMKKLTNSLCLLTHFTMTDFITSDEVPICWSISYLSLHHSKTRLLDKWIPQPEVKTNSWWWLISWVISPFSTSAVFYLLTCYFFVVSWKLLFQNHITLKDCYSSQLQDKPQQFSLLDKIYILFF